MKILNSPEWKTYAGCHRLWYDSDYEHSMNIIKIRTNGHDLDRELQNQPVDRMIDSYNLMLGFGHDIKHNNANEPFICEWV